MTSTYNSTAAAMKKVREAATGGVAKKVAKKGAQKVAAGVAGAAAKQAAGRVGGLLGGVPGWLAGTIGAGLIFELLPRLTHGSTEDQMREQMQIQKKLEMEEMGGAPTGGGAMGGYAAAEEPTMYEMQRGLKDSQDALQMGLLGNNVERNVRRNRRSPELEGLIAADADRISGIGSRRQLTPHELESILNG
jgi:hypothetical protein